MMSSATVRHWILYGTIGWLAGLPVAPGLAQQQLPGIVVPVRAKGYFAPTVTFGAPRFRTALANKIARFTGLPVNPETDLCVTCGSTEATVRREPLR